MVELLAMYLTIWLSIFLMAAATLTSILRALVVEAVGLWTRVNLEYLCRVVSYMTSSMAYLRVGVPSGLIAVWLPKNSMAYTGL